MGSDEVDRKVQLDENATEVLLQTPPPLSSSLSSPLGKSSEELLVITPNSHISIKETTADVPTTSNGSAKDGHFFLKQLKAEQNRLLELAAVAEKYMDALAVSLKKMSFDLVFRRDFSEAVLLVRFE